MVPAGEKAETGKQERNQMPCQKGANLAG